MKPCTLIALFVLLTLPAGTGAQDCVLPLPQDVDPPTDAPAVGEIPADTLPAQPAGDATTQPATQPAEEDPAVAILRKLETAGEAFQTLRADMTYEVFNPLLDDRETRTGWVAHARAAEGVPAMFRVHFDTLQLDAGTPLIEPVDYAFNGKTFSILRHKIKQVNRYRVPDTKKADPTKLGEGPFPLPFGQKTEQMLEYFSAATRPVRDSEPKNTEYLRLTPREPEGASVRRIEMWVDRDTHLPTRIISIATDRRQTTIDFRHLKTDAELDENIFEPAVPSDWKETVEDFRAGTKVEP